MRHLTVGSSRLRHWNIHHKCRNADVDALCTNVSFAWMIKLEPILTRQELQQSRDWRILGGQKQRQLDILACSNSLRKGLDGSCMFNKYFHGKSNVLRLRHIAISIA